MLITKEEYYKKIHKLLNLNNETLDRFLIDETFFIEFIKDLNFDKEDMFLIEKIVEKYKKIFNNQILNHNKYKLSSLDMEIIEQIPEGGNWKFLSNETINKSKRLTNLQKTGGRTTFYGRLQWDKPCYTITTYFNRPGSGTHIHPSNNRVISAREAARLQSFPDDFYFYGNQRDILKQIGNAVPPLFAYQLAKSINEKIECTKSIDLFCGAGGMNIGFKQYGIRSHMSIDIDKNACNTLKINYPGINVINGDLTDGLIQNQVIMCGRTNNIDIICGGPPCQGFSMAGKRNENDIRNKLFLDYIKIVKGIKPKVIVFENVEGLISYNKGETYKEIIEGFKNIDYSIKAKTISMNEFGIPQKRKRIIIIGVRNDLNINPNDLFPNPLFLEKQITVYDAINDLRNCDFDNNAFYKIKDNSYYVKYLQHTISFEEFIEKYI